MYSNKGFYLTTKQGNTAHVLADKSVPEKTLEAIRKMIDISHQKINGLGDQNKTHTHKMLTEKEGFQKPVENQPQDFDQKKSKPLTFGQKAVGLTFNPSGDPAVIAAKQTCADAIDQMNDFRNRPDATPGQKRHASVAATDLETAQMRMVKALTWKED